MSRIDAECYALRYPDLLQGFCGDSLDKCDWQELISHMTQAGAKEARVLTCYSHDVRCYARRYPDLMQTFCDESEPLRCNWHNLLLHWHVAGKNECAQALESSTRQVKG